MWKPVSIEWWLNKRRADITSVKDAVNEIIGQVRSGGDEALRELTTRFDKIVLDDILVDEERRESAYDELKPALVEAIIEAEARISRFHEMQKPRDLWLEEVEPGVILGVKTTPLDRIGAYVPGGRAAYLSTALMCAVPARVAGVGSICCCTPPPVHPATLAALDIAGVDEVYSVGGAQVIAAMALGTGSIAAVDKIVGPGNVYVTQAKMLLREEVEIDFPAGPSEIGILADGSGDPAYIAADILAQAEHDPDAAGLLVTTDAGLAEKTGKALENLVLEAKRRDIISGSIENAGYILADTLEEGAEIMNLVAPEHLSIQVKNPLDVIRMVRHAGSIFIGRYSPVACRDYASGTNHVLPTAGNAKTHSGLDVRHFCKSSTIQIISREGLESVGEVAECIACAEGLYAHADSVRIRRRKTS
jgi:histidinol dehydrogenase